MTRVSTSTTAAPRRAATRAPTTAAVIPPPPAKKRERSLDGIAANDTADVRALEANALASLPAWAAMVALEGELERTLKRRRLQCQECLPRAHGQTNSASRRLKLTLGATRAPSARSLYRTTAADAAEALLPASLRVRVCGHVLDDAATASAEPMRFSALVRTVVVVISDALTGSALRVAEWRRSDAASDCDGFEVVHAVAEESDRALHVHALIDIEQQPARYVPSAAFAQALKHSAATVTKVSAVLKVWEYCKAQRLVDTAAVNANTNANATSAPQISTNASADRITADATLSALFGVQSFRYAELPELLRAHLLPAPPLQLAASLEAHEAATERWAETLVDVPTPQPPFDTHRNNDALRAADRRTREALADADEHRQRRSVLHRFAHAPVAFLEHAAAEQSASLKLNVLGGAQGRDAEDERQASHYFGRCDDGVAQYLASRPQW